MRKCKNCGYEQLSDVDEEGIIISTELLSNISRLVRKAFLWTLIGWLISISSSITWNLGYKWANWTGLIGIAIFLTGLTSSYKIYKEIKSMATKFLEVDGWS
jgi:hypothetical protein